MTNQQNLPFSLWLRCEFFNNSSRRTKARKHVPDLTGKKKSWFKYNKIINFPSTWKVDTRVLNYLITCENLVAFYQWLVLPWRFRLRRVDAPGSVGGSCKMCHQPSLATKSWIPVQTKWSWKHLIITWLSWNRRTSREFEAAPPARCLRADSHPKKNICGRQHNSNPHSNDSPFVNGFLSPQIIHFKPSLK